MENAVKCWCKYCGRELEPSHTGTCPFCGHTGKDCAASATVSIGVTTPSAKARQKRGSKILKDITQRSSKKSRDPNSKHRFVDETIVVDKETVPPMWHHSVKNSKTGEVVEEQHVPLLEHTNKSKGPKSG